MPFLLVLSLPVTPYTDALALQRDLARRRIDGSISEDVLVMVEHPAVVTLGRLAQKQHLLASPEELSAAGVELYEVERGGDITFHGPGQLVGYPIIDLKRHRRDLHWHLRQLEAALIAALGDFGIAAQQRPGLTGVWTGGRKIASIGVHARDWVTWHGFALNVTTDLRHFERIVPCGIDGVVMTSMAQELGAAPDQDAVRTVVAARLAEQFGLAPVPSSVDDLADPTLSPISGG